MKKEIPARLDENFVSKVKNASATDKPMSLDEFKAWLATV
jgi:hypothetical protein